MSDAEVENDGVETADSEAAPAESAPAEAAPEQSADADAGAGDGGKEPEAATEDGKTSSQDEEAAPGAPENYADFTFPEGVEVDQAALDAFTPLAKEMNLSQEQAQKFIDLRTQQVQQEQQAFADTVAAWEKQAKEDKDIGGAAYDKSVGLAKKAIDHYGSEGLSEALEVSGLAGHPEVIRIFSKIGAEISEDVPVKGDGKPTGPMTQEDAAKVLFPKTMAATRG